MNTRFLIMAGVVLNLISEQAHAEDQSVIQQDIPSHTQAISIETETGFELGSQVSGYRYQEHVKGASFMHETGAKVGVDALATKVFEPAFFITGNLRFAHSENNYKSPRSGIQNNVDDILGEGRLTLGKDFLFNNVADTEYSFSVAPYVGAGYRNLFNDLRGTASSGSQGYRRDSKYFYVPVGLTPRFRITDDARISTNVECDELLYGIQRTDLSDFNSGYPNISNGQPHGYGLRGDIMVGTTSWSFGPFINYWNIAHSEVTSFTYNSISHHDIEPNNKTIEYGLQALYHL